jgi:hypothetical protein
MSGLYFMFVKSKVRQEQKNDDKRFQLQNIFVSLRDFSQVDMDIRPFWTYTAPEIFFVRNLEDTCQS